MKNDFSSGIFLLLGTNLGDRMANLKQAANQIELRVGQLVGASHVYETSAWGNEQQGDFYNQVVVVKSTLPPTALLETILSIEHELGRVRTEKWGPRIIDIDILLYDDIVVDSEQLSLPHPGIPDRRFTLVPLVELAPTMSHPVLNKTFMQLLEDCTDDHKVKAIDVSD